MHSIRVKIMAVIIAAMLTSILALGGIGILNIRRDSDHTALEEMNLLSENMQLRLDAYFTSIQQSVDMAIRIAKDSLKGMDYMLFSSTLTPEEQEELDAALRHHSEEIEHAFSAIANNTNGIITYYYCINADLGSAEHGFFWSSVGESTFVKQPPLNSDDLDIADTEHTIWYYSPLKAGRAVWVGPYLAHYLGEMSTLSYVAPIYYAGFLIGVMGMDIPFETITSQVDTLHVYDSGFVFLMDREGNVLYHPSLPAGTSLLELAKGVDPELMKHSTNGEQQIRYIYNGQEKQLAFSTLSNHIKVGVTVPVSEITASQRRLSLVILLVAIAILAVFSLITMLLVTALTKPLLNLAAASEQLVEGNYDVKLDYTGQDEVGTLTRAFGQMRDHMKYYISDLNSKAYTDAMTGIRNKGAFTLFLSRLNAQLHQGEEEPEFGIIVFDCNDLKQINDQYGHSRGDQHLKSTCQLICRVFSHSPVFRLGGDEFCAVLQQEDYANREQLQVLFEREIDIKNKAAVNSWEKISVASGLAVYEPESDETAEQVFSRADEQMYRNKKIYHSKNG